jgi:hypothetical protein
MDRTYEVVCAWATLSTQYWQPGGRNVLKWHRANHRVEREPERHDEGPIVDSMRFGLEQGRLPFVFTEPTWKLVLDAVHDLSTRLGTFRLDDIVREVQKADPERAKGSIQPTVQGMTVNAGTGPPSPCGKPLRRVSHGVYELQRAEGTGASDGFSTSALSVEVLAEVPAGDSQIQRDAETEVLAQLSAKLGVSLVPERIVLSDGSRAEIDGASQDPPIIAEIWAHQGPPKSAQRNKVLADALKLAFVAADTGIAYRKLLVFTDAEAAKPFAAKSWFAGALRHYRVDIEVVDIPTDLRAKIIAAQERQFR